MPVLLFFAFFTVKTVSAQTIGLHMRDFEGTVCNGILGGSTTDDNGTIPSCTGCPLWLSNDMWVDHDDDNDGNPDGGTSYTKTSSNCPELFVQANAGKQNFVIVRVLFNSDFFPSPASAQSFTYSLKVSFVQASLGLFLNNFMPINTVAISFNRTAGNSISSLSTTTAGCRVVALASGIKDGFIAVVPFTPSAATTGHYCLLAELEKTSGAGSFDALNKTPGACITADPQTTTTGYVDYVRCNDNVIWRNIQIVTPPAGAPGEGIKAPMQVLVAQNANVLTTIEVQTAARGNTSIEKEWKVTLNVKALPAKLQQNLRSKLTKQTFLKKMKWNGDFAAVPVGRATLTLPDMKFSKDQKVIPIQLNLRPINQQQTDKRTNRYVIHIMQYEQLPGRKRKLVGGNSILITNRVVKPRR